jgi:K+/H+ antiporter YhaU regulatory subunit KhtT
MTLEIILIFSLLGTVLLLFLTGWLRMDIVALLVVVVLAVSGLLSPEEALSGFSNPAVITVWAMFILSATLYQTGVAQIIGKQLLYITGYSDRRMITIIMVSSGLLSTIINNIGVAALMLPVVMDMSRTTGKSPSRLLIPLAFGCHLGGLTTLIGTPPNLLISFAMEDQGFEPFSMFDFSPLGFSAMAGGILFMALVGPKLLSGRKKAGSRNQNQKLASDSYSLSERIFILRIREQSDLVGKTLEKSRLRAALGLNVLSIKREGENILAPGPGTILSANDKLFVLGRIESIEILQKWNISKQKSTRKEIARLLEQPLNIFEASLTEKSSFKGKHLLELDFPQRLDINLLALSTGTAIKRSLLGEYRFQGDENLLLQGRPEQIEILVEEGQISNFHPVTTDQLIKQYKLHEVSFIMELSEDTHLFDKETAENEIGTAFGLTVMALINNDGSIHLPQSYEQLRGGRRHSTGGSGACSTFVAGGENAARNEFQKTIRCECAGHMARRTRVQNQPS